VPRLQERRDGLLRVVDEGDVVHRHGNVAQEALAEQAQAAVVSGTSTTSSWSWPCGEAPRTAIRPMTWNSTLLSTTYWPSGSTSFANSLSATVWPSTATAA